MALIETGSRKSTSFNAATQTRYVYLNTIYWDDTANKKVIKRKIVGKIDPITGQEVETGPVGRPRHQSQKSTSQKCGSDCRGTNPSDVASSLEELSATLERLESDMIHLRNGFKSLQASLG